MRTRFVETEALLLALEDGEADSGNTEATEAYLERELMPNELRRLEYAAGLLAECARRVRHRRGQ